MIGGPLELTQAWASMESRPARALRNANLAVMETAYLQVDAKGLLPGALKQLAGPSAAAKSEGAGFVEVGASAEIRSRPLPRIFVVFSLRRNVWRTISSKIHPRREVLRPAYPHFFCACRPIFRKGSVTPPA